MDSACRYGEKTSGMQEQVPKEAAPDPLQET